MRSREIVAEIKAISRGRSWPQREACLIALRYIADEAGHADIATIKRVAALALGRD